jgi:hypothetical protein
MALHMNVSKPEAYFYSKKLCNWCISIPVHLRSRSQKPIPALSQRTPVKLLRIQ